MRTDLNSHDGPGNVDPSLDVTIKCHEPRTYADSEENIKNKK